VAVRNGADSSATNEAAPANTQGMQTLEPTSRYSEYAPDPADSDQSSTWQSRGQQYRPQQGIETTIDMPATEKIPPGSDEAASHFGAALADVVRAKQESPTPMNEPETDAAADGKRRAAPAGAEPVPFEPAMFNEVQPGKTTREELLAAWGRPADEIDTSEGTVLTYDSEPFQAVDVLISPEGHASAIKITLPSGLSPKQLASQLGLEEFETVAITDDGDHVLGMSFPERGVVFVFDPSTRGSDSTEDGGVNPTRPVSHVVIQTLDARAFALRAENHLHGPYEKNIRDLKTAISVDSNFTHARWLLAEIYLATGQGDLAEAEALAALELEPDNAAYQLRHGQTLFQLGEYDRAVHIVRSVLDSTDCSPVVRAQAMHEMARLAALGDAEIAGKAISFDTRAIEIADQLATSGNIKERRAAKRLLVEAHLAIAEEVARQPFSGKVENLSQWITRASGLAEDYITSENGTVEMRLLVAQRALAAFASFKPALDPGPWVAEAEEAAASLRDEIDDTLWHQRIAWELGQVYLHALRTEHLRRETVSALRYGQLAIENLAKGAAARQAVPAAESQVGQLYFHVGAVYAVHQQDHKKAVPWYDKAVPLVTATRPESELYSPRRDGEMLVSMGVSYWQAGNQSRALELTQEGAKLVEAAVEDGILSKASLAVPYGNLASMYQQVGETANASKYSNLAKAVGGDTKPAARTGRSGAPRTGRTTAGGPSRTGLLQTGGQRRMTSQRR
jgi:tetratricopeptide (TPR) repeat protein